MNKQDQVKITAAMLHSVVTCERRPWMDLFADPARREEASPFLEMLWRRGRSHEDEMIGADPAASINLQIVSSDTRESATRAAIESRTPLIYGGRLSCGDLLGEPDLLRHIGAGKYSPGDIKTGAGEEGGNSEAKKPKRHYAVQLALYVDILERLDLSDGRRQAFIWDVHGEEIAYDLVAAKGKRSPEILWSDYEQTLSIAREIISETRVPVASYQGECKNCVWYGACLADLEERRDLTLLPGLGKSKRAALSPVAVDIPALAHLDPARLLDEKGESIIPGIGVETLLRFRDRAILSTSGGAAYIRGDLTLPEAPVELFFDIETDPMTNHCYLHGFVERRDRRNDGEHYHGFFSESMDPAGERGAFAAAWDYVQRSRPCVLYTYSKYERTWWRALQVKYPDVCAASDIESVFSEDWAVDLLAVVQSKTEWPTRDYSIKSLAQYLGFSWRDTHPSGAASIEWYDRFTRGEAAARDRILQYNEDDCRAMRVLLDGIRALKLGPIADPI